MIQLIDSPSLPRLTLSVFTGKGQCLVYAFKCQIYLEMDVSFVLWDTELAVFKCVRNILFHKWIFLLLTTIKHLTDYVDFREIPYGYIVSTGFSEISFRLAIAISSISSCFHSVKMYENPNNPQAVSDTDFPSLSTASLGEVESIFSDRFGTFPCLPVCNRSTCIIHS